MIKILELFGGLKVEVYSDGRVKSLDSKGIRKNGRVDNRKGKFIKVKIDRYGYEQVTFSKDGRRKTYAVHRLVATAFIPNPEDKETVNHIDGNKTNNKVDNLEWATHKEQKRHSIERGLSDNNIQALAQSNEKRSKSVLFKGKVYPSIRQASRENQVHGRVIKREGVMLNE